MRRGQRKFLRQLVFKVEELGRLVVGPYDFCEFVAVAGVLLVRGQYPADVAVAHTVCTLHERERVDDGGIQSRVILLGRVVREQTVTLVEHAYVERGLPIAQTFHEVRVIDDPT